MGAGGAAEVAAEVCLRDLTITECTAPAPSAPARIWTDVLGKKYVKNKLINKQINTYILLGFFSSL